MGSSPDHRTQMTAISAADEAPLPLRQVARIPAQPLAQFLVGEAAAVLAPGPILDSGEPSEPQPQVELSALARRVDERTERRRHAPIVRGSGVGGMKRNPLRSMAAAVRARADAIRVHIRPAQPTIR